MLRVRALWLLCLACCAATEGPLLVDTRDVPQAGSETTRPPADVALLRPGMSLQYQLSGSLDETVDADLFVVDLFETDVQAVARLQARGSLVAAYVSAGSHEPGRADSDQFPAEALGNPLSGYPRESWLDVRDATVREIMQARLGRARDKGFDAVLLSALVGYQVDSGHDLTAADQLDYNLWLADRAHEDGLAAGVAGDFAQAAQLAPGYDFAIHFDCISSGRCDELAPYTALGKAVFDLETGQRSDAVCAEAARLDLPVTFKRSSYDAFMQLCP